MTRASLSLLAVLATWGCGTQYADPIAERPASAACSSRVAQFDGAAYGTAARLIQDDFTIEAWIRTASSPKGSSFADGSALVFADVEAVQLDDFSTGIVNDKLVLSVGGPDTAATSTSNVTSDEWLHVAVSRKRHTGVLLLFVNGSLEASAVGNAHALDQSPTLTIAGRSGRNFYTGLLADVRLWATARSQAQIVANMHRRLSGNEEGLVSYYRLDEDALELAARDSSPSGNDAVLTGSVSWPVSDVPLCE